MVMWGSMLLAAYLAGLELEPLRYAATLIPVLSGDLAVG